MVSELEMREDFKDAKAVWLTPLIHNENVFEKMMGISQRSLAIIGSKDYAYREERWNLLIKK